MLGALEVGEGRPLYSLKRGFFNNPQAGRAVPPDFRFPRLPYPPAIV